MTAPTARAPRAAEAMPKPVKTRPSLSWSGVGSSGMRVRVPGGFWHPVVVTVEAIRSGIDLYHVDSDARPQDDLFGHVNGRWLAEYEMPADRATDGAFRSLYDRAEEQVRDLITEAAASGAEKGTDEQRIGDL